MKRIYIVVAALAVSVASVSAQGTVPAAKPQMVPVNPVTDSIKQPYTIVKGYLTKSAEMMPEKDYSYKPAGSAAEVRTFGQILGHVANANFMFCNSAMGQTSTAERGPGGADFEKLATKAEIQKALADSFAACDKAFAATNDKNASDPATSIVGPSTRLGLLSFNAAHDFEHYGNLVTYFRSKGMVPPSSSGK